MLINVIYQTVIHSFESVRNGALVDVIRKMTRDMALDGVTSFLSFKDVTNTCKRMQQSPSGKFFSAMAESLKKLNTSNVFSSCIVC